MSFWFQKNRFRYLREIHQLPIPPIILTSSPHVNANHTHFHTQTILSYNVFWLVFLQNTLDRNYSKFKSWSNTYSRVTLYCLTCLEQFFGHVIGDSLHRDLLLWSWLNCCDLPYDLHLFSQHCVLTNFIILHTTKVYFKTSDWIENQIPGQMIVYLHVVMISKKLS